MRHANDNAPAPLAATDQDDASPRVARGTVVALDPIDGGRTLGVALARPDQPALYLTIPADSAVASPLIASMNRDEPLRVWWIPSAAPRLGQPHGRVLRAIRMRAAPSMAA